MPNKVEYYKQLADTTERQITGSYRTWTAFLSTVGRLYKYPYEEQIMIHAQRPDATACAEYDFWNKRMGRYVQRGTQGIALLDNSGGRTTLRYIFDVSDTGEREKSRRPNLWKLSKDNYESVSSVLTNRYGIDAEQGIAQQLEDISSLLAASYWADNEERIIANIDDSFLSRYDDNSVKDVFFEAAQISVYYTLMYRCGANLSRFFQHEDFMPVFDFNTPKAVASLGSAVSEISEQVLREIEITIRSHERVQSTERSGQDVRAGRELSGHEQSDTSGQRSDVPLGGGLPDSRFEAEQRGNGAAGQVRDDAPDVPQGTRHDNVEHPSSQRGTAAAPSTDRPAGEPAAGGTDAEAGESGGGDGGTQGPRPDEMGGADERLPSSSGGNYIEGDRLQLTLFPSEQEQIRRIDEAESVQTPSAYVISQADIDAELRHGTGFQGGKLRVYDQYQQNVSAKDIIAFLKKEYYWVGHSHTFLDGSFGFVDYRPSVGMTIKHDEPKAEITVKWTKMEKRLRQLIQDGNYLTPEELAQYNAEHQPEQQPSNPEPVQKPVEELDNLPENVQTLTTSPTRELTQADIDAAIQEWNGIEESKQNVVRYMEDHARERETAAWLRQEYGDDLPAFPVTTNEASGDIPWPKVQRRIAQLIQQDRFYTQEEHDDFIDVDPAAVREILEESGVIRESNITPEAPDISTIIRQVESNVEQDTAQEETTSDVPEQSVLTDNVVSEDIQPRDPLAPAYKPGDIVYLDDTAFEIDGIGIFDVHLIDMEAAYPILRAESKERFEMLLQLDSRNSPITEFLSYDLKNINDDLREVLTNNLLTAQDKDYISGWLRSGEGNTKIAQRLSEALSGRADTIELQTGERADYFALTTGFEVNILDNDDNKKAVITGTWSEIAMTVRTLYQMELDGFVHEPEQQEPIRLEGKPVYNVGDHVILPLRDREITGDIQHIGEFEVTISTGPYSWSNETVSLGLFEDALRQDERNADLFAPAEGMPTLENFRITDDDLGIGSPRKKFRANMDAITTLKTIEAEGRPATDYEKTILSKYVGWGGLPNAFDANNSSWESEYQELLSALTPAEYEAAKASTLNAHYTTPLVIKAVYDAIERMGFTTGNILEPSCGVGNFFGLLPDKMKGSNLYGVELDSITGRIAQQLYPNANIQITGFEKTNFPNDYFDIAIGNVPFGAYHVNDPEYNKLGFTIHNYFLAKSLDKVRPGGVVAMLTSRYTMDAKSPEVRKYLAERAELLGAIRLPQGTFKANAGTEAVIDILFLQKRERPIVIEPDWVHLGQTKDGLTVNNYFVQHPEMVLGKHAHTSTQYEKDGYTVEPLLGTDLSWQFFETIPLIKGQIPERGAPMQDESEINDNTLSANPSVKNYSFTIVNGEVYFRENDKMNKPKLPKSSLERVKGMIELRDCVRKLIDLQMDDNVSDATIKQEQARLNELYDDYTDKYGLINDRGNRQAFSADSSYYLLCSLEVLNENGKLERKADMFSKRTIQKHVAVTHADTASEALAVSIGERARVDLGYMSQLTGKSEDELVHELRGVLFRVPNKEENGKPVYQTADEYLSGMVRVKLREAQRAAETNPEFAINVEALTAAQPKDLDASEIEVRLGATWIDKKYYQQFMYELLDTPAYLQAWGINQTGRIEVQYSPYTANWWIENKTKIPAYDISAYTTFGTSRASAYYILEESLNLRDVRIYDTIIDENGKDKRVLNAKETTLAAQKQQAIRDAFKEWIWQDPQRRQALVKQYNEEMNGIRPREYDGSHIIFSGMNPEINLRPHQRNAIAHVLYGGNTMLAHEVGAGKTFEMIAAAMESKRLGLCKKSIFVVPNHLTEQWSAEFLRLYPAANILVTTRKDFEKNNRKKFCARIATGDYDAIIIGHSQFEKIPISFERRERLLNQQIEEISEGIEAIRYNSGQRFTVKQLELTRKKLRIQLEKLRADDKKDDVVTFEQLGVDRMFVDESQNFKNLFLVTKMRNVAGLSTADAQKTSDMYMKCRYLDEITGSRGSIFASGTPVSNSMTELFSLQRYLQHDRLEQLGMGHFDCWASRFGETVTALELAPEGTGYRARTRFSKFFNLPELMNLFKEVADIKTADQLNLPVPKAEYHNVVAQPTEHQLAMVQELSARASAVHSGKVDSSVDNMLKITSDGRKLGLDQRIIDPLLPDEPSTKVNQCVDNIMQIWQDGQSDKLTQLVFCDISTPKPAPSKKAPKTKLDDPEIHAFETLIDAPTPEPPFTVYDDIRKKLIDRGMPSEQIAFIHDADTEVKKKELFSKVRSGKVRVLIGSTQKMGAGTNVRATRSQLKRLRTS